ncbi:hypothetical protein L1080_037015 [Rhodococcus sp. MSC1_016]|uniref:hypothetical protein n=1 Tax=Rhodococcus sp. MSC1_016 TaxID=2909266 RepID=UPI00202FFFA7|nr:hypothetical protein [Rhodococcus sp. MSC1_016]
MTSGGGTVAAFGLKYQYMATVEQFLLYLRDHPEMIARTTLIVEPLAITVDGTEDDIVDFAIETDDEVARNYQVKSSLDPATNPLQPASARGILQRLITHRADNHIVFTNKPLSPQLAKEVLPKDQHGDITTYTWPDGPAGTSEPPLIVVDSRSPGQVRDSIAGLIREFRKDRALSQGQVSASLLVSIVLDHIFEAAAGNDPNRITALDALEVLAMPDGRIAHVAGGFDWGLPIAGIPNYISTIPRLSYLDRIRSQFPDDGIATPRRIVLTGHTGTGKSVIASDYCHLDSVAYEFICWIDCRDVSFIESQVTDLIQQLTQGTLSPSEAAGPVFTGLLGRHRGPWLLVFDGIQNRADIETYVPSRGRGLVLLTTNNSLNWWPSAEIVAVGEFTKAEAVDCFASYAGVRPEDDPSVMDAVVDIVSLLGCVPIAVSMAGVYFKNTEGTLAELAPQYFSDLAALDDSYSIPPGFHRTAFKAVQHAVRSLTRGGPTDHGRSAAAVLYVGSLLAPELLPLNMMLPATAEVMRVDPASPPKPAAVEPALRRGVITALRSQSIARRVLNDEHGTSAPTSETIAVHPLVHDILQRSYLEDLPPGQLQAQAGVLMCFLYGWIGQLRGDGEFFATEQLRLHAEALLELVDEREPLSSFSEQHARSYTYTKALLQAELSACHASRRRFDRALELGKSASAALAQYGSESAARGVTILVLSNMITDLSFAEAPSELLTAFSAAILPAIFGGERDEQSSIRNAAYVAAGDMFNMLNRTVEYQQSTDLRRIRSQLKDVVDRDPDHASRAATTNVRINELYETGQFQEILLRLPEWRGIDSSPDANIGMDALEIVAQLHTGSVDEALRMSAALVGISPYGGYLSHSLLEALKKVGKELELLSRTARADDRRVVEAFDAVHARFDELTATFDE